MKKLTVIILIGLLVTSCAIQLPTKPYLVVGKSAYTNTVKHYTTPTGICEYTFITSNGYYLMSDDSCTMYHIGDTIK